jgi:hypothetical protein
MILTLLSGCAGLNQAGMMATAFAPPAPVYYVRQPYPYTVQPAPRPQCFTYYTGFGIGERMWLTCR